MIGPVHHKRRREQTVQVVLRCDCGYAERWPLPFNASPGRCTCPECGGQLHEPPDEPKPETVWKVAA